MIKRFLVFLITLSSINSTFSQIGSVFDIEGNTYSTITIGDQEWMTENLRTSKFNDGSSIQNTLNSSIWNNLTIPSWCNYNNDLTLNDSYGKLYNRYVVVDSRNVCPVGWRVPSIADWDTLFYNLGGQDSISNAPGFPIYIGEKFVGGMMKSTGTIQASNGLWQFPNTNATNSSGFNGLPSGQRSDWNGFTGGDGYNAYYWTSTQLSAPENSVVRLDWNSDLAFRSSDIGPVGNSIRCVRDIVIEQGFFQWGIQQAPNETYTLSAVSFSSDTHGCAVGGNFGYDKILTTTDGGLNWNAQTAGTGQLLYDVQLVSANVGFAVGWSGTILKTIDGGQNWSIVNSGTSNSLHSIYFISPLEGWIVGGAVILHTSDGGQTWNQQTCPVTINLWGVHFISASEGYAVGENTILKTIDGGNNWVLTAVQYPLQSVFFTSSTTGYAVGPNYDVAPTAPGEGVVYSTNDGGASWSAQVWPEGLYEVHFQTMNEGWLVGTNGSIYKTNNGGLTWQTEISNLISDIRGVTFVTPTKGWAVSMGGGIISTTNGLAGVPDVQTNNIAYEIIPNPANDNATIKFEVKDPNHVTFELIDGYGREVKKILSQNLNSGEYNYDFSVIDLENGVYYGRLQIGGIITTRKIVIQKN